MRWLFHKFPVLLMLIALLPLRARGQDLQTSYKSIAGVIDAKRIEAHVRALAEFGSRVPGYPGHEQAQQYVQAELEKILGADKVTTQDFSLGIPVDEGATATLPDGSALKLACVWPNLVRTSALPPDGLTAPIVYGKKGALADLNGLPLEGAVVLLDFDCGNDWLKAVEFGAGAIIFGETPDIQRTQAEQKFLSAPIKIPRFYCDRSTGLALQQAAKQHQQVTLHAKMTWHNVTARNVLASIEGSDPTLKWQRVIVSAPYDSTSAVPAIAPGAENACSAAGLLELARVLKQYPPKRTVLILASGSRYQTMAGATSFLRSFDAANTNNGYHRQLLRLPAEIAILEHRLPDVLKLAENHPNAKQLAAAVDQIKNAIAADKKRIEDVQNFIRVLCIKDFDTPLAAKEAELAAVESVDAAHRASPQVAGAIGAMQAAVAEQKSRIFRLKSGLGEDTSASKLTPEERTAKIAEFQQQIKRWESAIDDAYALNKQFKRQRFFRAERIPRLEEEVDALEDKYDNDEDEDKRKKITSFFISLNLSAGSPKIGLFNRGNYEDNQDVYRRREYVPLGRTLHSLAFGTEAGFGEQLPGICKILGINPDERFVEVISGRNEETIETYFPEQIALECEPASFLMPAITALTCGDARLKTDTPHDTPDLLNYANIADQLRMFAPLFAELVINRDVDLRVVEKRRLYGPINARVVRLDQTKNLVPDTPIAGAVGVLRPNHGTKGAFSRGFPKPLYGVHTTAYSVADAGGTCSFAQCPWNLRADLGAYGLDANGDICYAPDLGNEGDAKYNFKTIWVPSRGGGTVTCVAFECRAISLVGLVDPRYLLGLQYLELLDGRTETQPQFYGYTLALAPRFNTSYIEPAATVFIQPDMTFKLTMSLGQMGKRLVLINATPEMPMGKGFTADTNRVLPRISYQVANDIFQLDEKRLKLLSDNGIVSKNLVTLHEVAGKYLADANSAAARQQWQAFDRNAKNAWSYESRVYPDVISVSNDVVKGVIFYLALVVPFAWFMERLLFAFADVRWRILCVAVIFAVVLGILSLVHPAMKITMTPFLIFLAFIILALGGLVTGIILLKFNVELNKMKGGMAALRHTDVSRLSAAFAAFNLGVSYMRRRRVKTLLTCVTLVLLTFTVLSFTSIKSFTRYNKFPLPFQAPYEGIMYRSLDWSPLEETEYERFKNELGDDFVVAPRAWHVSNRIQDYVTYEVCSFGDDYRASQAQAMVGLSANEPKITGLDRSLLFGRWLKPGETNVCIIPQEMATLLGVTSQNIGKIHLKLLGESFTVVGVFRQDYSGNAKTAGDDPAFDDVVDLNDDPLMPASFQFDRPAFRRKDEEVETASAALEKYDYMRANNIVVIPFQTALQHGATIRSVAAVPKAGIKGGLDGYLEKLMTSWSVALYAGVKPEEGTQPAAYLYSSIGASALGAVGNIVLPIAIAGLIILNTMLGSVYEREKEIWTYSSVGLSPVHISALFIAESCVYAVVGSITGYLLGQVVTFATAGHSGLMMNYSSMSTVFAVFLVIAVTVASSLYPAYRAHKLATPDIARTWQVSDPVGDLWELNLPFIITVGQAPAFNAYMRDFLEAHSEESVGKFFTKNIDLAPQGQGWNLAFDCWLAPYDFGVSQRVELITYKAGADAQGIMPDEDEMAFRMAIHRLSGDDASWRRTNKVFLNTLRKTFLIWRILDDEDRAQYQQLGKELIQNGNKE